MARRTTSNREEPRGSSSKKSGVLLALLFLIIVGVVVVAVAVTQIFEVESTGSNSNDGVDGVDGVDGGDGPTPAPMDTSSVVTSTVVPTTASDVPTTAPTVTGFQACNGLESLCDVRANELLYATLHNAVSTVEDGVSFFANHDLKLETALVEGWRGLNFDIGKCDGVRLVHGACGLGTRDPVEVFTNIQSFLQDNPNEVLLMPVQIDDGLRGGAVTLQEIYAVMQQVPGFTDLLYQHTGRGTPWPTLRQLIAEDTRILFFHYNGENCEGNDACPAGFHDWFVYAAETQFEFNTVADLQNTTNSCEITRGSSGERDFFGVNLFTRLPSDAACELLNAASFATNHLLACSNLNDLRPASVLVDCWDVGGILQAVDRYNVQLEAPR